MKKTNTERVNEMALFLEAIAADPVDETSRLVFADWLEERGDWRAEFLRLDRSLASKKGSGKLPKKKLERMARWDELWARLSPDWQAVFGRSFIENCERPRPSNGSFEGVTP